MEEQCKIFIRKEDDGHIITEEISLTQSQAAFIKQWLAQSTGENPYNGNRSAGNGNSRTSAQTHSTPATDRQRELIRQLELEAPTKRAKIEQARIAAKIDMRTLTRGEADILIRAAKS